MFDHTHTHLVLKDSRKDAGKERRQIAGDFFMLIFSQKGIQQQVSGGTFRTEYPTEDREYNHIPDP